MRHIGEQQKGFTLIELMIVIAIVGILAAIALPAYQDYIVRSKMSEPLAMLAEAKTTVAEYVAANGDFPDNVAAFGVNIGTRVSDIVWAVDVSPANPTAGDTIHIGAGVYTSVWEGGTPDPSSFAVFSLSGSTNPDGTMAWDCVSGWGGGSGVTPVPNKYLPANCRG